MMVLVIGALIMLGSTLEPPIASPDPCPPDRTLVAGRLDAKDLGNGQSIFVTVCDPPNNPTPGIYCCVKIQNE